MAGKGAKGQRLYDWAFLRLDHDGPAPVGQAGTRWLLVRRNRTSGELAFYRCFTPRPTRWPSWSGSPAGAGPSRRPSKLARALPAWTSTRCAAGAPGTAGPPTLAMLAHAFLVVAALAERTRHPAPPGLIPVTCNELQHLFAALVAMPINDPTHRLGWSSWRRRHQGRARTCHYRRHANGP